MTYDQLDVILQTMPDYAKLKPWKIRGIAMTLTDLPMIAKDETRLTRYLENCMLMEGVAAASIGSIVPVILSARGGANDDSLHRNREEPKDRSSVCDDAQ